MATSRALVGKGNHVTRVDKKTAQRSQARLRDVHPDAASVIVVRCPNVVTELSMSESSQENIRDCEHRIRERAYHLWEADGCPEGRAQEYWERAQASINNEDSEEPAPSEALGTVPQADVAAEREIAERAGNQQNLASTPEKKDR